MDAPNFFIKLWGYIKVNINLTHLIAFSLGVITICFLDALVFEKSITDWISAVSTFGTLIVAYLVYRKAPEWLGKKLDEESVYLATDIHFILYDEIANESTRLRNILYFNRIKTPHFSNILYDIFDVNSKLNVEDVDAHYNELLSFVKFTAFSELAKYQMDLIKKLRRLRFMQWKPIGENQFKINCISESINNVVTARSDLNAYINPLLPIIKNIEYPSDLYDTLGKIESLENTMINSTRELLKYIDDYKSQPGDVLDYFERANKKQ